MLLTEIFLLITTLLACGYGLFIVIEHLYRRYTSYRNLRNIKNFMKGR